ncbi:MAG: ribonuclease E/G, partial [Alphaproteobacteria bacterium]
MSADTILVDQVPGETRVAALAEGRLVDLAIARGDPRFAVGAIHLGRIAQVVEGFDGAFVDIGLEQAAFLRRSDALAPPRAGDTLPVQIVRAVAGEKGLGVSGRIRLAGWLLDWTPGRPGLRAGRGSGSAGGLALVPSEGAELRPAAGDVPAAALEAEAALLREAWDALATAAARAAAPMSLAPAPAPWLGLAAHHGATVRTIAFADRTALAEAQRFARDRAPALGDHLGVDPSGIRLFETHGVEEEIAAALRRRVPLRGGGALTIDEAEALTVVDVDAGTSRS